MSYAGYVALVVHASDINADFMDAIQNEILKPRITRFCLACNSPFKADAIYTEGLLHDFCRPCARYMYKALLVRLPGGDA